MNVQHDLQASHQCKGCFIHLHQIFYFTFSSKPIRPFCPPPLCLNGLVLIEVCVIKETSGWVSKLEKHIKHPPTDFWPTGPPHPPGWVSTPWCPPPPPTLAQEVTLPKPQPRKPGQVWSSSTDSGGSTESRGIRA